MSHKTLDLLSDMVKLVKRYGPEEFERLASLLSDPCFTTSLAASLSAVAKAIPAPSEKEEVRSTDETAQNDPNLDLIRDRLMSVGAYPHIQDIVEEAERIGVGSSRSKFKSRKDAVRSIIKSLEGRPPGDIEKIVHGLRSSESKGSLEEWSRIIMERKR